MGRASDSAPGCPDRCLSAVRRAYRELCERGQPDRFAFEAALAVYQWHHPEVETARAHDIVLAWVSDGVRH